MKATQSNFFATQFLRERSPLYFFLAIAAFCFLIYSNTIPNNYGMDDHLVTNHNPIIEKGISGLYEIFTTNYISENGVYLDYRPLVKASFAIEYSVFGWNPHISHLINVLLYALACCLILRLLLEIFEPKYFSVLFIGVLLYVAHPMHTEVVASLKSRDEILVLIFVILSSLSFLKYAASSSKKYFAYGILFFLFSLLSKISGIPFIVLIPLMYYVKKMDAKTAICIVFSLAILTVVYYLLLIKSLPGLARTYEYVETPLPYISDYSIRLGTALYSLLYYIKLIIAPVQFSFYYGINFIELKPLLSFFPLASLIAHTALLGIAIYFFRKNIFISFFLFFYLVQISLVSNVILPLPGVVGERVLFIASLSFCVLIAFALDKFLGDAQKEEKIKPKKKSEPISFAFRANYLQLGLVASLLLFYSYETIARNSNWKDTITLFEADMPHLEKSAKANYMMAREIRRLYRTDKDLTPEKLQIESTKAIHYYHQAINAYPNYAMAIEELGMLYAIEQKNNSMAIPLFEKAFSIDSTLWRSANNLGMAFQISKDTLEAISWYEKSLKAKADNQKVVVELAKLYYLKGQKQKALAYNDRLMKINPDSYLPYYNYAIYNMLEHDTANVIKYFEEDVKRGDQEKFPYLFLIKYYLENRDTANAIRIRNFVPHVSR